MTDSVWNFDLPSEPGRVPHTPPQRPRPSVGSPAPIAGSPNRLGGLPPSPPAPPSRFGPSPVDPPQTARVAEPTGPPRAPRASEPAGERSSGSPWGWRALAAFVAGGVLTAGGFFVGSLDDDPVVETVTAPPTTVVAVEEAGSSDAIIVSPPDLDTSEPAAFVAEILGPSVVQVETDFGLGSGVVFDDGLILTNQHVVEGANGIIVRLSDGRAYEAELRGSDARVDVAVLDVGPGRGLQVAELATGVELDVGQLALAIGSPFQLQQTVTSGIISAVNRPVPNGVGVNAMIQTDTAINPGNSGGALADRSGRVIGLNTSIQTGGAGNGNVGVGFAIPIDTALSVAERILAGESLEPGFLGVGKAQEPPQGEIGIVIGEVTSGSGADQAGIEVGDRVIKIDGAPVSDIAELAGLVQAGFPGDEVELELIRDGEVLVITATLGQR